MAVAGKLAVVAIVLLVTFAMLYLPSYLLKEKFSTSASDLMMKEVQETQGLLSKNAVTTLQNMITDKHRTGDMDDSDSLLQMQACYQVSQSIDQYRANKASDMPNNYNLYSVNIEGMYSSFDEIESKIINEIQKFKDAIMEPIKGKVYVSLTQVPYYKNERGNPMNVGYYVNDRFDYAPTNVDGRVLIYYFGIIVFADYDTNKKYTEKSKIEQYRQRLYSTASNDKQCFLRCMKSSVSCGCASYDGTGTPKAYPDDATFNIQCLGRSASSDAVRSGSSELAKATFWILFQLSTVDNRVTKFFFTS
jgi:hypothetical protein